MKLINLAQDLLYLDPFKYLHLKEEIERRALLREFGALLSKPVRDEDHELDYVVSQYLAEYIADQGFDGILFKSAMAKGRNLVLFNPDHGRCSSVRLRHVVRVTMQYEVNDR